jgi:hypothetical protein
MRRIQVGRCKLKYFRELRIKPLTMPYDALQFPLLYDKYKADAILSIFQRLLMKPPTMPFVLILVSSQFSSAFCLLCIVFSYPGSGRTLAASIFLSFSCPFQLRQTLPHVGLRCLLLEKPMLVFQDNAKHRTQNKQKATYQMDHLRPPSISKHPLSSETAYG